MRRLISLIAALTVLVAVPIPVAAATTEQCRIDITPSRGAKNTVYRITGRHFPISLKTPLEVDMVVSRPSYTFRDLANESFTIFFVFLVPGLQEFYVDFNESFPGEPPQPLRPGRYGVQAWTPHVPVCNTAGTFLVR